MSTYTAPEPQHAISPGYVVVAPQASDILAGTLRAAYAAELTAYEQFSDLIDRLDLIEIIPR